MKNFQNDSEISKIRDSYKIKGILWNLAHNISSKRTNAKFIVSSLNGLGDDSAKQISLIQIGPEKSFLRKKRKSLISVREADYSNFKNQEYTRNNNCPIQITCSDSSLEDIITKKFDELAEQLEVPKGISIRRLGYSIK